MLSLGNGDAGEPPAWRRSGCGRRASPRRRSRRRPTPRRSKNGFAEREVKTRRGFGATPWLRTRPGQDANAPSRLVRLDRCARLVDAQAPGLARRVRALLRRGGVGRGGRTGGGRLATLAMLVRPTVTGRCRRGCAPRWVADRLDPTRGRGAGGTGRARRVAGAGGADREDERYRSMRTWLWEGTTLGGGA